MMVGMTARISMIGLITERTFHGAYCDRQLAVIRPIGTAISEAMMATQSVPVSKGSMPY